MPLKRLALMGALLGLPLLQACSSSSPAPFQANPAPPPTVTGTLVSTLTGLAGAEMLDVAPNGNFAVVVGSDTITLVTITGTSLSVGGTLVLPAANLPAGSTEAEFTGVSISPDSTFALVGVKDNDDANLDTFNEVPGKVIAVSLPGLAVLGEVTVGRGPDSVDIAPNGQFAAVANEDEEDEENLPGARPGSISVIDLRNGPANMTEIEQAAFPTAGIPVFPTDPQPETVKISADSTAIFATLQENNAISRIDINTLAAGGFTVTNFDAGQRTGEGRLQSSIGNPPCLNSNGYADAVVEPFTSSREPDGLAITSDGRYVVTADEDNVAAALNDGAGSRFGARSISVFDAVSGAFLGDSGNSIEEAVVEARLPMRCSAKGPEPEVVTMAEVNNRIYAIAALERSDAISIHDITDPTNVQLVELVILNPATVGADSSADLEPEGIEFIASRNQVIVSNPGDGSASLVQLSFE